jgi:DNA-binding PadR family transcriptional regulator
MNDPEFELQRQGMECYFEDHDVPLSQLRDPAFRETGLNAVREVMECPPEEAALILESLAAPTTDAPPSTASNLPETIERRALPKSESRYGSLGIVVLSLLLEQDRIMEADDLELKLIDMGLGRTRVRDGIARLTARKLIKQADDTLMASQEGVDYLAQWSHKIEDAHQKLQKRFTFSKTEYLILNHLAGAAERRGDDDDWALRSLNEDSVVLYLSHELGLKEEGVIRNLLRYQSDGFLELQKPEYEKLAHNSKNSKIINIRITEAGRTELATIREAFADQIAEINLRDAIFRMREEVNHMRRLIGEPTQEFDALEDITVDDLPATISGLEATIQRLEARIDATDSSMLLAA